jgi:hypothetical protein
LLSARANHDRVRGVMVSGLLIMTASEVKWSAMC